VWLAAVSTVALMRPKSAEAGELSVMNNVADPLLADTELGRRQAETDQPGRGSLASNALTLRCEEKTTF
jgi:hypothetical protein